MSENETVAAPVVATEAPAAPVTETVKPQATDRHSARQGARALGEKYAQAREEARQHHSANQPRDEVGKFAGAPEVAADAAASAQVPGGSATTEATTTQAVAGPPEGMVRIELPEGHPLRDQGKQYHDVPAGEERVWRELINSAARRKDVEAAERRFQEAEAARLRTEAALRFYQEHGNSLWTPEHQALYNDILQSYAALGPEKAKQMAEAFKRGVELEAQQKVGQVTEQADMAAVETHWSTKGEEFRTEAFRVLPDQYPGLQSHEIQTAIEFYARDVAQKQEAAWQRVQNQMTRAQFEREWARQFDYSGDDFFAVTGDYLKTRPGVIAEAGKAAQAAQLRESTIRAEVEAAQREKLIGASQRHATNPQRALGGVPSGARTTDTTPERPDPTTLTGTEIKRSGRERARAMGEAFDRARGR